MPEKVTIVYGREVGSDGKTQTRAREKERRNEEISFFRELDDFEVRLKCQIG